MKFGVVVKCGNNMFCILDHGKISLGGESKAFAMCMQLLEDSGMLGNL